MGVHERKYRPFADRLTPSGLRFLVPTRYAFRQVFTSRLFLAFFALCFAFPLGCMVMIYLRYNVEALAVLELTVLDLVTIDSRFFRLFLIPQGAAAFIITLVIGPALISPDLRNNAMPLYLSRPFSKTDYLLGKMTVLAVLLSLVTWIPGLLLFALQSYLAGGEWLAANVRIAFALFTGSWVWILVLSLVSLSFSVLVKRKILARILFLGLYFIMTFLGEVLNTAYDSWKGSVVVLDDLISAVWDQLFGVGSIVDFSRVMGTEKIPPQVAWLVLAILSALCLVLLMRRIRAYEVVT